MTGREQLLDELRPGAFAVAYRMLGSVAEAEDVVQEALLRVHQALDAGERIASPRAFVATVTTRLAINELRSARVRREHYVGQWLPEPIVTDSHDDPARQAEMADSLSLAMLVLLERLSPEQRAVLLLHEVFGYSYPEVAAIVGKGEDNVRQLASRARRHLQQRRPRFQTTREQREELARRFLAAVEHGDMSGAGGVAGARRGADRRRRRQGSGAGAVVARAHPCRAHARQLLGPGRPRSGRVVAPGRGQRRPGRALARRTAAVARRGGAGGRRRSGQGHQRDRQPRQTGAPGPSRPLGIAAGVGEMNSGAVAASPRAAVRGRASGGARLLIHKDHQPRPGGAAAPRVRQPGSRPMQSTSRFKFP
jgi:RNA polymerase sigma factor (sigma-70 family)